MIELLPETGYNMGIRRFQNADAKKISAKEILQILREIDASENEQRKIGRQGCIPEKEILQSNMHGKRIHSRGCDSIHAQQESKEIPWEEVRGLRGFRQSFYTSQGSESGKQFSRQLDDVMFFLSYAMALEEWQEIIEKTISLQNLWQAYTEIGYVFKTLSAIQKIWRSMSHEEKEWICLRIATGDPWCAEWPGIKIATENRQKGDSTRIKALGNSCSPQQVYPILQAIAEVERTDE